jgi:branched-chain amino acid transport system substrate-binding protein
VTASSRPSACRPSQLQRRRARSRADEINAAGGIKALGGAKINLVVSDSTSNPTTASTIARRLITENEVTAILGAFASSLTLAISEVTARADIPFPYHGVR